MKSIVWWEEIQCVRVLERSKEQSENSNEKAGVWGVTQKPF